jgi:glycine hydroxymethyltransferase
MVLREAADPNTDGFFTAPLESADPELAAALARERGRQRDHIELIASENIVSRAVLDALGDEITNKTVEGYPGKRFHAGARFVDEVENLAIARARELFGVSYVNVQPHSGSQANQAVFFTLLSPGDRVLSMDLAAGGHLSHGAKPNMSGRWFEAHGYGVRADDGTLDYEAMERLAAELEPKLIIAGGSAYPREINFACIRRAADAAGAHFLVDMAHFAGLVAAGAHPSPVPHAHIVTCTTTKTLRGPRGGVILSNDDALGKRLDAAVFPGVQGSIHLQVIAAKAACFREALLLDVSSRGATGAAAEKWLEDVGLTANKNATPTDPMAPSKWTGIRLGSSAGTTRGFAEPEFARIGHLIADALQALAAGEPSDGAEGRRILAEVEAMCRDHPIY